MFPNNNYVATSLQNNLEIHKEWGTDSPQCWVFDETTSSYILNLNQHVLNDEILITGFVGSSYNRLHTIAEDPKMKGEWIVQYFSPITKTFFDIGRLKTKTLNPRFESLISACGNYLIIFQSAGYRYLDEDGKCWLFDYSEKAPVPVDLITCVNKQLLAFVYREHAEELVLFMNNNDRDKENVKSTDIAVLRKRPVEAELWGIVTTHYLHNTSVLAGPIIVIDEGIIFGLFVCDEDEDGGKDEIAYFDGTNAPKTLFSLECRYYEGGFNVFAFEDNVSITLQVGNVLYYQTFSKDIFRQSSDVLIPIDYHESYSIYEYDDEKSVDISSEEDVLRNPPEKKLEEVHCKIYAISPWSPASLNIGERYTLLWITPSKVCLRTMSFLWDGLVLQHIVLVDTCTNQVISRKTEDAENKDYYKTTIDEIYKNNIK